MNTAAKSLHSQVEKWLAPGPQGQIRVVRFGHRRRDGTRYAHVEASTTCGARAIFFVITTAAGAFFRLTPAGRRCQRILACTVSPVARAPASFSSPKPAPRTSAHRHCRR